MLDTLQYYIACFGRMNCNKRHGETAPHKAVMLLTVIEEVKRGHITNGFIPLNDRMVEAFKREWKQYVGETELFNPVFETPFFHLSNEPFWELMRREPFSFRPEYSLSRLRENFYGAKIPDELCEFMQNETSRRQLKRVLLEKYLPKSNRTEEILITIAAERIKRYLSTNNDNPTTKLRA